MLPVSVVSEDVDVLQGRVQALEQERRHLLAVIEILQDISGSLQVAGIAQTVARRLGETFGLDRCSIFLADRGGRTVRLVASYEDPSIRNYVVDLERYPELRRALQTAQTVFIPDVAHDPTLWPVRAALLARKVKTLTVIPISWRGVAIGAISLRTFRDGPTFSDVDVRFCQVVASLTAKALRNAHRFERLMERRGEGRPARAREREQAALIGFLQQLLATYPAQDALREDGSSGVGPAEIERLVEVARDVLTQDAAGR